jgi:hypothetical protein
MSDWRIFFWAMLHSPEFKYCGINLPLRVQFRREYASNVWRQYTLSVSIRSLSVYLPWSVRKSYTEALGLADPFDDIPF